MRLVMKGKHVLIVVIFVSIVLIAALSVYFFLSPARSQAPVWINATRLRLPEPRYESEVSVEEALLKRRSVREYARSSLTLQEVSQLLWAAQGVTDPQGLRTAPSAGALYPLEVYLIVGEVESLAPGVYKYVPDGHEIIRVLDGDKRVSLAEAALGQAWVRNAAIDIVIASVYERTTRKYGERGIRYVHLEAGHAAQNICLQAVALNLGVVTVGAFYDDQVKTVLSLPGGEQPLYIIPVGRKP
ncbi:MAG: SagB/ThcOx family dehydrogenase [Thermoproteota archaeon]